MADQLTQLIQPVDQPQPIGGGGAGQVTSPVIKKTGNGSTKRLSFPDAIQKVKEGKKVTKLSWNNNDYLVFKDDWVKIYREENKLFHQFIICGIDLLDNDWVEIGQ